MAETTVYRVKKYGGRVAHEIKRGAKHSFCGLPRRDFVGIPRIYRRNGEVGARWSKIENVAATVPTCPKCRQKREVKSDG